MLASVIEIDNLNSSGEVAAGQIPDRVTVVDNTAMLVSPIPSVNAARIEQQSKKVDDLGSLIVEQRERLVM